LLADIEQLRLSLSRDTTAARKAQLGQFLTPVRTASFMAGLFRDTPLGNYRLLDPGAGIGSLTGAFLERCLSGELSSDHLAVTAIEVDDLLRDGLKRTLSSYASQLDLDIEVVAEDFIEEAVNRLQFSTADRFTHAILNPPYKKLGSGSRHRKLLRQIGIETVNLYTAFVALSLELLMPGGQLVAVIPRSFCNGPYYRPFREFLLQRAAIHHIHLFAARNRAFRDDDVLQENIIILLERDGRQVEVSISTSTDDQLTDIVAERHAFEQIVHPSDRERFIHIPASSEPATLATSPVVQCSLADIGLQVSTGPVVDFRLKAHLRETPTADTVPLLYPAHLTGGCTTWPRPGGKKPNAIVHNPDTEKWLYPNGCYCLVRRFSSKEEKRRIVATVVRPESFPGAGMLGFENHLNVFHENRQGLPVPLAQGLAVFLNSTVVDEDFRRFSGHTQVNATDLRRMKYPDREALMALGRWAMGCDELTQAVVDERLQFFEARKSLNLPSLTQPHG